MLKHNIISLVRQIYMYKFDLWKSEISKQNYKNSKGGKKSNKLASYKKQKHLCTKYSRKSCEKRKTY